MQHPNFTPALARFAPGGRLSAFAAVMIVGLALPPMSAEAQTSHPAEAPAHTANHVEVTAEDYAFRIPAEIPSGWTTFRFENAGDEHHLMFIARLPEGQGFEDYVFGVMEPFNEVWMDLRDGTIDPDDVMPLLVETVDPWFWETEFMGGVGFLEPGATAEATMNLPPGNYVVECYMRTPDGEMHSIEGMLDPFTVVEADAPGSAPMADVRITLSASGMQIEGEPTSGPQTFEVFYADHPEDTFGHDVQVVRLDDASPPDQVLSWLDFTNVEALTEPAPGTFIGGVNQMPVGSTAYFTTDLIPGRYLFLSEFTGFMGVFTEVTIPEGDPSAR